MRLMPLLTLFLLILHVFPLVLISRDTYTTSTAIFTAITLAIMFARVWENDKTESEVENKEQKNIKIRYAPQKL